MDEAIEVFGNRLKRGGVGLFYYAGHGVQVNGANYLLPIGARINKEADVKYQAVDANKILDEMATANNNLNIVMLDACRDNPFARSFRNAARGLAIVAYDNGTVLDTSTNLMWTAKDNGSDIDWHGAKRYCESYRGGGYTDWRMPTPDELAGLYNKNKLRPATCAPHDNNYLETELIDITCFWVWASEKRSFLVWTDAAAFSFYDGLPHWYNPDHIVYYRALPVRSGK